MAGREVKIATIATLSEARKETEYNTYMRIGVEQM